MPCPGDPANSVYVSIGLNANAGSRPGPPGCVDTYQANYESIEDWYTARQRNLVTAGEVEIVECYDDWPSGLNSTGVRITNFTTDASNYIIIRSAQGEGPTNVPEDGFYLTGSGSVVLYLDQSWSWVVNIGIVSTGGGLDALQLQSTGCSADRCFVRADAATNRAVRMRSNQQKFLNNFVFGGAIGIQSTSICRIVNNTVRGSGLGIEATSSNSSVIVRNNVVFACTTDYSVTLGGTLTNNVDEDGSAPGNVYTITDPTTEFLGSDGSNLHIRETAGFRGLAVDMSSDPDVSFDNDIDNDTRTVPWDCGADEFTGAAPPSTRNTIWKGMDF